MHMNSIVPVLLGIKYLIVNRILCPSGSSDGGAEPLH